MLMVAEPLLKGVEAEVYVPLVRTILPVGVLPPAEAATPTVTESAWVVRMVEADGVTVTAGATGVT